MGSAVNAAQFIAIQCQGTSFWTLSTHRELVCVTRSPQFTDSVCMELTQGAAKAVQSIVKTEGVRGFCAGLGNSLRAFVCRGAHPRCSQGCAVHCEDSRRRWLVSRASQLTVGLCLQGSSPKVQPRLYNQL